MVSHPVRSLVVEDEAKVRLFLREALSREGHVVVEAASGERALELLRDRGFDVAILDLVLAGRGRRPLY
jgi:DNA-binding response OmpR family regulator